MRVTRHKINAPLRKGTNGNDTVKMGRQREHLALIDLVIMELTDNNNVVLKYGGPKIPSTRIFYATTYPDM